MRSSMRNRRSYRSRRSRSRPILRFFGTLLLLAVAAAAIYIAIAPITPVQSERILTVPNDLLFPSRE